MQEDTNFTVRYIHHYRTLLYSWLFQVKKWLGFLVIVFFSDKIKCYFRMIDGKKRAISWIKHCQVTLISVGNKVFRRKFDRIFFILFFRSRRRGTVFLRMEREGKERSENATNLKKDVSESESPWLGYR